jgi:hypothetical protein
MVYTEIEINPTYSWTHKPWELQRIQRATIGKEC